MNQKLWETKSLRRLWMMALQTFGKSIRAKKIKIRESSGLDTQFSASFFLFFSVLACGSLQYVDYFEFVDIG
jgi:hypothetical protein